ncbi:hypothetical protein G7054_g745 [Neopestalotiopsis clavispora]|nr:hypothetical protein G7054_g745 [Neopestalotiopsis clavispora]
MHVTCRKLAFILLALPHGVQSYSAPPVDIYFRRKGHAIVVVGDYLYMQGGEISWNSGNGTSIGQFADIDANRESWTNETVEWIETNSDQYAPSLRTPALWPHGDSFFTWGGSNRFGRPESEMLWKLTADGAGGGNWTQSLPANSESFYDIHRTTAAARAICNGVGLYLGGYAAPQTDQDIKDAAFPVPGLLTYDVETATWSNKTTKPGLNEYGTSLYAAATCLEKYGGTGVFVTIGGQAESNPSYYTDDGLMLADTSMVSLYDVEADKWLKQNISGQAPERRDRTCLGIANGQNGSTDIYMYGGQQMGGENTVNKVFNDIWLLSIPAFTWFKLNVTGTPRTSHDCVIVGSQLVSVGGMGVKMQFNDPDEWRQGLGVLDLTTMAWADRFNPNSTVYDSPQVVKDWYRDNDFQNNNWTSNDVKALFTNSTVTTISTNGSGAATSNTKNQEIPIGSIVGGTVGGIVAVVAILAFGFWYWRWQRSKNVKAVLASGPPEEEMKDGPLPYTLELYTQQWYYAELNGRPGLFQLPTEGSERPAELGPHADGHVPMERRRGLSELAGNSPVTTKR